MINKVQLIGNLGADPEVRTFESGTMAANFTLATSDSYTNKKGEKVTNTEWHNISVIGKLAEIVEKYFKKGAQAYIEGSLKTRSWDDKDGNKRYITEVVVRDFGHTVRLLGRKDENNQAQSSSAAEQKSSVADGLDVEPDDDLPF